MTLIPDVTLHNGVTIPQVGFGTFKVEPQDTKDAVLQAFEVGYRHIDTAQLYQNERGVGEALAASGLSREEVFLTSKLSNAFHRYDDALRAADSTLAELGVDQVDLYLVHWPLPTIGIDYVETWKAMIKVYEEGKARAIGVSNFQVAHLQRLLDETGVVPAANQIEIHPYFTNDDVRGFCARHDIAVEAWSPLAQGEVLGDPVVAEIAARVGRTPAQVVLRWHVQRGDVVFPKSMSPARMAENLALFDFELPEADMAAITALGRAERLFSDPDTFDWVPEV